MNVCDEDRDGSDDSDCGESFTEKKVENTRESVHGSVSTGLSSESSSNSDKSDEEKLERKHKKSKTATFKSKLPKKATDVLKNWFLNNIQNPYPSHEAKELLSKMTGLTRKQIQNWFTNSRKRFLEPLKKKLEGQKFGKDGSINLDQAAADIFGSETQSQVDPSDSVCASVAQEPIFIPQTTSNKPNISFTSSLQQTVNENIAKSVSFQKVPSQLSPQGAQPIMYPAQANNFIVVPWVLSQPVQPIQPIQPVYPYRTFPNLLSMNTPQLIPIQQNNYPTANFALSDAASAAALQNQFAFPLQQNLLDMSAMMKQQIPTGFSSVGINLYANMANMNHQASVGQIISANQERMAMLNKRTPYATQTGISPDPAFFAEKMQRSTSALYHARPDLSEINRLGPKYIHIDEHFRPSFD